MDVIGSVMPEVDRRAPQGQFPGFQRRGHLLPPPAPVEPPEIAIQEAAAPVDVRRRDRSYRYALVLADGVAVAFSLMVVVRLLHGPVAASTLFALPALVFCGKL